MKYALATIAANLVAMGCVASAVYLAANDKEGWGWFLFLGVLCAGSVTFKNAKDDEDDDD